MFWMQIGILVASPTSSIKSILSFVRPHLVIDSSKTFMNYAINGPISSSNSSLLICLWRSSSSIKASQLISASLFPVRSFLSFSMASRSLNLQRTFVLGSQPYFLANSPPKSSKSKRSILLAPKFLSECVPKIFIFPLTNEA